MPPKTDAPRRMPGGQATKRSIAWDLELLSRHWRARLDEVFKQEQQTYAKWRTLRVLRELGAEARQRDLAAAMGIEEPGLVRLLDALEQEGLLGRETSRQDRRANFLRLHPRGLEAVTDGERLAAALLDEIFMDASQEELEVCVRVVKHALDRLHGRDPRAGREP